MDRALKIAGRFLLALIFIVSGTRKLLNFHAMTGLMASKGIPLTSLMLGIACSAEILGGLSVVSGIKVRWGAAALILFLIPTTLIFHNFWAYQGMDQQAQIANFLKNISIMGGLLALAGCSKD